MDRNEMMGLIAEALEVDALEPGTELASLDAWDSMGRLSLIVMCDDEFGKKLTSEQIRSFETVQDILDYLA